MRRPLVGWTFHLMGGILVAQEKVWLLLIPIIVAEMVLIKEKKEILFFGLAFLCGIALMTFSQEVISPSSHGEKPSVIEGEVVNHDLDKEEIMVKTSRGKRILVYLPRKGEGDSGKSDSPWMLTGKEVNLEGHFLRISPRRNPGGFDSQTYFKTRNLQGLFQSDEIREGPVIHGFRHRLSLIKEGYCQKLKYEVGVAVEGLVRAMVFGQKQGLKPETYGAFQENGIAHLLAASGLHTGILYGGLILLFRNKRKVLPNLVVLVVLLTYAFLTGFSLSVMRAVMMIALYLLSRVLHRPYDLLSATCMASVLLLIHNPWYLFAPAFQLSFSAVVFIALGAPYLKKIQGKALKSLAFVLGIQLWMMPLTIYYFHHISPVAPLANLIMVGMGTLFLFLGFVSFVSFLVFPPSLDFFALLLKPMGEILLFVNETLYAFSGGAVEAKGFSLSWMVIHYGILLLLFSEAGVILRCRKKRRRQIFILTLILLLGIVMNEVYRDPLADCEIVFIDVGQGSSTYIQSPEGKNIVIDGGGSAHYDMAKRVLIPFLQQRGVNRVDLAIATHLDMDHYGGIQSLCQRGKVDYLGISPYCGKDGIQLATECHIKPDQVVSLKKGDVLYREKDFSVEVLGPLDGDKEGNEGSLVLLITYGNEKILIAGDIGKETEGELVRYYDGPLSSDILVAPHHGSNHSSSCALIEEVNPKYCVIQVGKNNYGHPGDETIEKYRERDIMIYRTDTMGAIGFDPDTGAIIAYLEAQGP